MAVGGKSGSEVLKAARRRSDKVSQLCGNNPVGVIICVQKAQRERLVCRNLESLNR